MVTFKRLEMRISALGGTTKSSKARSLAKKFNFKANVDKLRSGGYVNPYSPDGKEFYAKLKKIGKLK